MSILDKYNNKPVFEYDNKKGRSYTNLRKLVERFGINEVYTVHALFINTQSRFGDNPVIVTNDFMVNAPQHLTETVQEMMRDHELIELVNKRKVGFQIYAYENEYGKNYSLEWVEI